MKKGRILSLLLACMMILSLAACGAQQEAEAPEAEGLPEMNLQLGTATSEETSTHKGLMKFAELVSEKTDGKLTIDIYPNSQLGADRELLEACQMGDVAMVGQTTAPQVNFIPTLAVFDMASTFPSREVAYEVFSGPFKDEIAKEYDAAGFKLVSIVPQDFRQTSSNKEIRSFEDFEGLKIRTMENPYHMEYWRSIGTNPTPLAFSELYIALQQGVVDAEENMYETIYTNKLHEQQKYVVNTNHIMFLATVIMNKDIFEGLPEEYQTAITESMAEADQYTYDLAGEKRDSFRKDLEDYGVEVIDLPEETHQQMREAAKPAYDMIREAIGDDIVDKLLTAIDEAS